MPGTRLMSWFQIGKESTPGTPVAATKRMDPDLSSAFTVDWMKTYHEGRQTGAQTPISYSTQQGVRVDMRYVTPDDTGVGYDQLPYFFHFPGGGTAGSGSTAVTWGHAWGGTALGSALALTVEYGDDTQNYEAEYSHVTRIAMSAAQGGMTQLSADLVGRQSTKSTKTALAALTPVRIPGYLWKPRFATAQSGLSGGSDTDLLLQSWSAEWTTGLVPRWYQNGLAYFGQTVQAAPVLGTVNLTVESIAAAVTQFYDKGAAGTVDFLQLKATSPQSLGGSNYSVQLQFGLEYQNVQMLSAESDGVNLYEVTARIVYDSTWGQSVGATVVCNLASL